MFHDMPFFARACRYVTSIRIGLGRMIGSRPKQVTSWLMARVVGQARHLILRSLVPETDVCMLHSYVASVRYEAQDFQDSDL